MAGGGVTIFGGYLRIHPPQFWTKFTLLKGRIVSWDSWDIRSQRGYYRKSSKKETAKLKESDRKARTETYSQKLLVEKESIQVISEHPAS